MKAIINNLMQQLNALQEKKVELEKIYDKEDQWIRAALKNLENTNEREFNNHIFVKDEHGDKIYRIRMAIIDLWNTIDRLENIDL